MNVCCGSKGNEFLTEQEDGLVKPYSICSSCNGFIAWVKLGESDLVQKILKQNLDQYKRKS